MDRPTPLQVAPFLEFNTLDQIKFTLSEQETENFQLLVFYRGLHCPICERYLQQLQDLLPEFAQRGVDVVALSMDSEKRARLSRQKWGIDQLKIGYGLDRKQARDWGLYLSKGVKEGEPEEFSEPGLFLIDKQNKVYYAAITSNPWGRPYLPSFVKAVDYITRTGYPARGEVIG